MVGAATVRELLLVVAVAVVGVLLATVAAFTPWPVTPGGAAPSGLVELHSPATPADSSDTASG